MSKLVLGNKKKISNGWIKTNLDSISTITSGSSAPQGEEFFKNGKYPFVRVADMGKLNTVYLNNAEDHVNELGIKKLKLFPKGSILFTKSGASTHLNQKAILGMNSYVVSHIGIIHPLGKIPSEWIYYFLKTIDFKLLTHATTLPSLPLSKIKNLEIHLSPLNEQKRITEKIDELFSLIDFNIKLFSNLSEKLSHYRQSFLKTSFEIDSLKKPLEKCGKIGTGGTPSRKKSEYYGIEIPWVKTTEVKNTIIYDTGERITQLGLDNSNAKIHPKNSVVLAMYGEGKTRGRCAILGIPASTNQACAIIDCDTEALYYKYCFYWLQSRYYQIRAKSSGGNQPNLNLGIVKKLEIPLPDILKQKEIVKRIELSLSQLDSLIPIVNKISSDLQKLKNSILVLAFEGKLLPQNHNDDSAETLLEKILQEKEQLKLKEKKSRRKKNAR